MFSFLDAETIQSRLMQSPTLSVNYLKEKGIDKVVSELAAQRFAGKELDETSIKIQASEICLDIKTGKDGFRGSPLPKFEGYDETFWNFILYLLVTELKECAIKSNE